GLAFGHLAGMLVRKSFVAVAVSLMASVIVISLWVPSLVSGGLNSWQFLAIPVGMIVLARFLIWPWATDRLYARRTVAILITSLILGLAWIAGSLAYRVWEAPATPAPFDVTTFEAGFPPIEKNQAGNKIRQAAGRLTERLRTKDLEFNKEPGLPFDWD